MRIAYQTITWGGVVGHPAGVTSVKDLFYLANGPLEPALEGIAAAGYDGFEIFDGNLQPYAEEPDVFRRLCDKYQLEFVAVYSGANFIYQDILEDEFWRIRLAAKWASSLGARYLVVGGGAIRSTGTTDEDFRALAAGLDKVVEIAKGFGMEASYHPHLGTISQLPEGVDEVFRLSCIPFCPDLAHLVAGGGDALAIVRKHIDRVNYVHLKDYRDGEFLPLGDGTIDIRAVLVQLKDAGYDGWYTVETDYFAGPPEESARRSMQFLKAHV